jgi:hypothetical protein
MSNIGREPKLYFIFSCMFGSYVFAVEEKNKKLKISVYSPFIPLPTHVLTYALSSFTILTPNLNAMSESL